MSETLKNLLARLSVCAIIVAIAWGFTRLPKDHQHTSLAGSTVLLDLPGRGHGSGVYIGNGVVLTAAHVAKTPGLELVTDKGERLPTELLWLNKDYDVAALFVRPDANIQVASLSCRTPRVGERITSRGNPEDYQWITTFLVVAGHPLQVSGAWKLATPVSGPIIPGMSGGPAFDENERVIGINVRLSLSQIGFGVSTANGLSFIVPSKVICLMMGRA